LRARKSLQSLHIEESVKKYIVDIITATREVEKFVPELKNMVRFGASPRASKSLLHCAMAHAFLDKRDFVTPDDVFSLAADVLRHRLVLSFQAVSQSLSTDSIISALLDAVPAP